MAQTVNEVLRNLHPQRNTFTFDDGVIITSDFDSGNLWKCLKKRVEPVEVTEQQFIDDSKSEELKQSEEIKSEPPKQEGFDEYEIWIAPDSIPYQEEISYRTWFFFSITGFPKDMKTIRFRVMNMSNQGKLISYGLKSVFIEFSHQDHLKFIRENQPMFRQPWKRIKAKVDHEKGAEGMKMYFHHQLKPTQDTKDVLYFAFTYPYTFEDVNRSIEEVKAECSKNDHYFHKQTIIKSLEGRDIDLITITANNKSLEELEPVIENEHIIKQNPELQAKRFDKPCIMVTSRVHCGETPGSYMLQGMLDLLMDFTKPYAKILLETFVFKIIPCLNPDGVARGYWRNDTSGVNLNRHYTDPSPLEQPTIYGTVQAIIHAHSHLNLKYYTDLHGHATKRGCFVFGNSIADQKLNIEQILLAKLMSMNSINFDLSESNFSDESNNKKDGKGMGRDSSGRAATYRLTQIVHSFTMECNYATGMRNNTLKPRLDLQNRQILKKEESYVTDIGSQFYKVNGWKSPVFDSEVFKDVGRAYLISILDIEQLNPLPRILKNFDETFETALDRLRKDIDRDLKKPQNIFKSKKGAGGGFKPEFEIIIGNKKDVDENLEKLQVEEDNNH
ncbi:zinc carboxypeptidase family protein [Stylonychia lemnae]|uniref:Zinc carboxypeptidase family protein n=1 Tax=Stylonychia lemnae TaxID=5949 RepID=A0A078ALF5_STYLE|nr:zinc carboxypeptidase family protein [Stylonychia lemnae]|eukprot:CDW82706.1 zinc carboxypeptidase family protein [Stylonychia lemnae]